MKTITKEYALNSYPDFYQNPTIQTLGKQCKWTVSLPRNPEDETTGKIPADARHLFKYGRMRGAWSVTNECLMTLDELTTIAPVTPNCTYHLNAAVEGYAVLDIEPSCPPEIAAKMLAMPNILYRETSMSGKGYHLILALPKNFWDYPIAANSRVLKEEHGWWEILLEHWITFTRNVIPPTTHPEPSSWESVYAFVAKNAREKPEYEFDLSQKPKIRYEEPLIKQMTVRPHNRKLSDFHGDMSRFEFAVMGVLAHRLESALNNFPPTEKILYTDEIKIWLIYEAAKQVLEHRDKHDEPRNGIPWLLHTATNLIAARINSEGSERE